MRPGDRDRRIEPEPVFQLSLSTSFHSRPTRDGRPTRNEHRTGANSPKAARRRAGFRSYSAVCRPLASHPYLCEGDRWSPRNGRSSRPSNGSLHRRWPTPSAVPPGYPHRMGADGRRRRMRSARQLPALPHPPTSAPGTSRHRDRIGPGGGGARCSSRPWSETTLLARAGDRLCCR